MFDIIMNRLSRGIVTKPITVTGGGLPKEVEQLGEELRNEICKKFGRSFHIREVDTGSCGGCESEIISTTNPIYDIQRFGIDFVASPRHADALLVTGPVSKNMAGALKKTYDAMPEPKIVITLGGCASDGGMFKNSYYIEGGVKNVLPVALHVPGCPPTPSDIIKYLLAFLKIL
jgi:Ni,Fe-hydrogenase III small subunit